MRKWFFFFGVILSFLAYGLMASQWDLSIIPPELAPKNPNGFFDYQGVTNVHSSLSNGSRSISDIIRVAQDSKLDFIFFSDLNLVKKPKHLEGYHNNLLVFIDGEYSYLNSRILNYISFDQADLNSPARLQLFLADQLTQINRDPSLGIFVLAHPFKRNFKWKGKIPTGLNGIEVFNLKSIWQHIWIENRASFFWTLFLYPFNSRLSLIRLFTMPKRELEFWDRLNNKGKVVGFSGVDAEAKIKFLKDKFINFPSYFTSFSLIRNHVLLPSELIGDAEADRQKLGDAISQGQFYMSFDALADPKGFISTIELPNPNSQPILMGGSVDWQPGLKLKTILPQKPIIPFDITYYRNGEKLLTSSSQETTLELPSPGVYRVMVGVTSTLPFPDGKKWIPWIFTNPFYVKSTK